MSIDVPPVLPRKVLIKDFNSLVYIPTSDVPHKKQYRVRETLLELLRAAYASDEVVRRFAEQDVFFGPDRLPETVLAANDWILPVATCWLLTTMYDDPRNLRVNIQLGEYVLPAALIEVPIRVTQEESPLSSMFKLIAIENLIDVQSLQRR